MKGGRKEAAADRKVRTLPPTDRFRLRDRLIERSNYMKLIPALCRGSVMHAFMDTVTHPPLPKPLAACAQGEKVVGKSVGVAFEKEFPPNSWERRPEPSCKSPICYRWLLPSSAGCVPTLALAFGGAPRLELPPGSAVLGSPFGL